MTTNNSTGKDTLYYDGSCPLCTAEVCKLAKYTGDQLNLQDIHALETQEQSEALPDKQVLLDRLHLKTANGDWLVGVEANVRAWQHTPFAGFWRILNWPVIRVFSKAAYEIWLKLRK
ncbi:MAG: DUF393 domain-containing protein [Oleiphilus sp.]|nr:MAG: DUF393 domain-containing protein [Oleiphilus sp.]